MHSALPVVLERGAAIFLFALSIFMTGVHSTLIGMAARRTGRSGFGAAIATAAFLSLWLGFGLLTGDPANFARGKAVSLPQVLVVGYTPMVLAVLLLFVWRPLRELNAATPSSWLIRVQAYRMAGLIFIFPFLTFGVIPAAFAVPAALGDFITGLLVPFIARAVDHRAPHALLWATLWNLFGILDLVIAPITAFALRANIVALYPLVLVPLFLGPPLGILTHIWSLRNLATNQHPAATVLDRERAAA